MVMRDSRDRAASLENAEDAQLKLKLANQAGDTFLSKAIAQAAATKGWSDIVNTTPRQRHSEHAAHSRNSPTSTPAV